ncbi:unnamed protein product [Rangifer tarandus platyrhynchus]|uniref:Uncharacterized protein n=2 Tax=Rangifer tarandus platyrhynchus TaxID=3082113 RepID=A0ABN8ZJS8_RANTA|nr:unnamed protein product [Rangifer tarandus platyrhynchus]
MNSIKVDCKDLVRKKICILIVVQSFSCVQLCVTLWTVAYQTPLSMAFSRQEYWSGLSFPPPGDLPNPRIEPRSPVSHAFSGRFFTTEIPGKPIYPYLFLDVQRLELTLPVMATKF